MYGYKECITVCTIFKNPQRKQVKDENSSRKSHSGNHSAVKKKPKKASCCTFKDIYAELGLRQHDIFLLMVPDALISEQRLGRAHKPLILGLLLRDSVWLAFSKFPVETSAHQAGMQPPKLANMSAAGGG